MRLSVAFTSIIKKKYTILEEQRPPFWCTCKILCFFCQLVGRRQLTSQDFSKYCFSHDMAYWRSMNWLIISRKLQGLHCAVFWNWRLHSKFIFVRSGQVRGSIWISLYHHYYYHYIIITKHLYMQLFIGHHYWVFSSSNIIKASI